MSDEVVLVGGGDATKPLSDLISKDAAGVLENVGIDDGTNAPSAADATGTKGTVVVTDSYVYVCVDTDTWKRVAISTWT